MVTTQSDIDYDDHIYNFNQRNNTFFDVLLSSKKKEEKKKLFFYIDYKFDIIICKFFFF